jgi:hypothetical protein
MFTEYVEKAMQEAEYEQMVDGNWWGQVTPLATQGQPAPQKKRARRNCVTWQRTG